ncbi:hypothetical protein Sarmat_00260 [Rickettsiales endosymbiont of Paramecium tredecaurelia]|nr:hypothetical protein [Candidatus Sarmatiella mevalonica]
MYDSIYIAGFPFNIKVRIDRPKLVIYNKFSNYLILTNSLSCSLNLASFELNLTPEDGLLFALQDKQLDQITHEYKVALSDDKKGDERAMAKIAYSRDGKIKSLGCYTGNYQLFNLQNQRDDINILDLNFMLFNLSPDSYKLLCAFKVDATMDNKKKEYIQVRSITNVIKQLDCLKANIEMLEIVMNDVAGAKCVGEVSLFECAQPAACITLFLRNHEKLIDKFIPAHFFLQRGVLKKIVLDHSQPTEDGVSLEIITDKNGLHIGNNLLFGYDN